MKEASFNTSPALTCPPLPAQSCPIGAPIPMPAMREERKGGGGGDAEERRGKGGGAGRRTEKGHENWGSRGQGGGAYTICTHYTHCTHTTPIAHTLHHSHNSTTHYTICTTGC
eukprot:Tamp_37512.p1 GENE.Tamp_37512~~Tamp_37512.p1  ORF type:complete len:113 (-),score=3.97 Tamp_37512:5-343(-)